jgi:hypothetical protein
LEESKLNLSKLFIDRFCLSSEQEAVLASATVSPQFFEALERTQQIYNDCKQLFLKARHQGAG